MRHATDETVVLPYKYGKCEVQVSLLVDLAHVWVAREDLERDDDRVRVGLWTLGLLQESLVRDSEGQPVDYEYAASPKLLELLRRCGLLET